MQYPNCCEFHRKGGQRTLFCGTASDVVAPFTKPPARERRTLLSDLLEDYLRKVVPASAGKAQIEETRRAFMAGAGATFGALMRGLSGGDGSTDADVNLLDDMRAELEGWQARMAALIASTSSTKRS